MWRSFFYAVGIMLMVLGGEALILESVVIERSVKLPKFINGLTELSDETNSVSVTNPAAALTENLTAENLTTASAPRGTVNGSYPTGPASNNLSAFGPSRFAGNRLGGYGGGRANFSNAGFRRAAEGGTPLAPQSISPTVPRPASNPSGPASPSRRIVRSKDWMPWSLMAVGAMIFLYTRGSNLPNRD